VIIPDEPWTAAAKLSERYITDRFLPDKAIDVIDEAGAGGSPPRCRPPEVAALKGKLEHINGDKENAVRDQNFEKAAALRDQERELQSEIRRKQEAGEGAPDARPIINEEGVAFIVSRWTGIPSRAPGGRDGAVAPHGRGNARDRGRPDEAIAVISGGPSGVAGPSQGPQRRSVVHLLRAHGCRLRPSSRGGSPASCSPTRMH